MILDITVAIILLVCLISGVIRGFIKTAIGIVGWFVSVFCAFFFAPKLLVYLKGSTKLYDIFTGTVEQRLSEKGLEAVAAALQNMPQFIQDNITKGAETITTEMAGSISSAMADWIFRIAAFSLIILAVRLVFWLLTMLIDHNRDNIIGIADRAAGGLAGLIMGVTISYILLALIIPMSSYMDIDILLSEVNESLATKYLYDYNIFLMVLGLFT